ncbi:MAG: phosphodiester glycosidase family protein [Muribaculaceae bacterium]|nr:phosphodiester glycosidase family protein [Muribaculaceae bacterium]
MSQIKNKPDLNDDEIRIINPESKSNIEKPKIRKVAPNAYMTELATSGPYHKVWWKRPWLWISIILFLGALAVFFWWEVSKDVRSLTQYDMEPEIYDSQYYYKVNSNSNFLAKGDGYVEIKDTVINNNRLTLYYPENLTPVLRLGAETLNDTINAAFVVQAADVRADNGGIVGAFVYEGKLLSRGQSKAGFCAIINGKIILGVADSTPYLEQAIESDGYFFRQFPLVVGGQMVENRLQLSSYRKALAELNGKIVVVMTHDKMTLNEFARILTEMGVQNAIYLVGSTTYGFAKTENGEIKYFGERVENPALNVSYLVWE